MTLVYLLNASQRTMLLGEQYTVNAYFEPVQDDNGNWIITSEQINNCTNSDFLPGGNKFDVTSLPTIPWVPPPNP